MSYSHLSHKDCIPCRGGVPPLKGAELAALHGQLGPGWQVVREHHLEKEFTFKSYREAVDFTNAAANLAEEQNHHPDLLLVWGKVTVSVWTHKIDSLTESDFIFAAKVDALRQGA